MDNAQLRTALNQRDEEQVFIRFTTSTGDTGLETIDFFLRALIDKVKITTWELLDMEQLWQILQQLAPGEFSRSWHKKVEIINWDFTDARGIKRQRDCCFRPDGLLAVYEEVQQRRTN